MKGCALQILGKPSGWRFYPDGFEGRDSGSEKGPSPVSAAKQFSLQAVDYFPYVVLHLFFA